MSNYRATTWRPPLVERALALAEATGFALSSIPEVGRRLRALAGSVRAGVIGEMGTGCGVGAAGPTRFAGSRSTTRVWPPSSC